MQPMQCRSWLRGNVLAFDLLSMHGPCADRWEPDGLALALDFSEDSLFLDGRWRWFCGEYGDGRNRNGEHQNIDIDDVCLYRNVSL